MTPSHWPGTWIIPTTSSVLRLTTKSCHRQRKGSAARGRRTARGCLRKTSRSHQLLHELAFAGERLRAADFAVSNVHRSVVRHADRVHDVVIHPTLRHSETTSTRSAGSYQHPLALFPKARGIRLNAPVSASVDDRPVIAVAIHHGNLGGLRIALPRPRTQCTFIM